MRPHWGLGYEFLNSPNLPPGYIVCAWCQKVGVKLFTLKTPNGSKAFCSELCFTQCRRASFKKNKICDWCKHVRHTVNYVDFQDGEQQLQFCSDKCLNQYKMNIFCKETQAHLQMHTHLKEAACKLAAAGSVNLITPDLWLRDCKANGNSSSPHEAIDIMEDINSDENVSIVHSPTPVVESPKPSSSPVIEKKDHKDHKPEPAPATKEKEKSFKKSSSKHSPKKNSSESKTHSSKHSKEKKINNNLHIAEFPSSQRQSPVQASPPAHIRNGQIANGSHSLLSPPPLGSMPRPPHHMGHLPPRHCPPVPSPLGPNSMEHGRQPFLHPNVVPPPFQFFAQQQMEAILRSQHGLDLRSKLPPHLPVPPWVMPPFPQMHPPPPPPHIPASTNPRSPSLSHSSPPSRNPHQSSSQKNSHHGKHKHHKHSSGHANNSSSHTKHSNINHDIPLPPSSLLPPVTVMVPFPLMLPIPLPIPVPIPIPPQVMDKYSMLKLRQQSKDQRMAAEEKCDNINIESVSHQKRKISSELSKQKKRQRSSSNDTVNSTKSIGHGITEIISENHSSVRFFNPIENASLKLSETRALASNHSPKMSRFSRNDLDVESRSYSPLSDALSSNEEEGQEKLLKNGDTDDFSGISFSSYNLSLMRSSPLTSQISERRMQMGLNETIEDCKSPSPTNLSVRDKHNFLSSNVVNFKKKHLRDHPSLVT